MIRTEFFELDPILDKLGVELVKKGMRSCEPGMLGTFHDCFVAMMYGERGELMRDYRSQSTEERILDVLGVAHKRITMITLLELEYVSAQHYVYPGGFKLRALRWLEKQPQPADVVDPGEDTWAEPVQTENP